MSAPEIQPESAAKDVTEQENKVEEQNGVGSSSSSNVDVSAAAQQLLNAGKRNLACDEYPQAVEALAEACQLLAEKHGDEATELAESYFYYGKSLLELARMENGVLGNALDGVSAEEENEAELSESDQFEKASKLPESTEEKTAEDKAAEETAEAPKEGEDPEEGEEAAKEGEEEQGEPEGEASADEDVEEAVGSSQDEDDADDIPNLQLAWEVLELSKKIYTKQTEAENCEKSIKIKLSEVYRVLGEVSLETGANEQAIQDITSCLTLQTECMQSDSRLIAETHYQLGNAYLMNRAYTNATEELRNAKSVIETRISNLESNEEAEGKDKRDTELKELKGLLPDIIAKVEDVLDESLSAKKAEDEVKAMITSQGSTTIGFGDSTASSDASPIAATTIATKKANDISNLVRKRKTEDTAEVEETKKAKPDGASGDKENGNMEVAPVDS